MRHWTAFVHCATQRAPGSFHPCGASQKGQASTFIVTLEWIAGILDPMVRKLRLEYPSAIYHVINRGNDRAAVFQSEGARTVFETCLAETCEKSKWVVHAWCVMSNQYHLALETPDGNLVAGMQWMQATFANRFNRDRGENGHLFQGRYKALVVEDGDPLGQLPEIREAKWAAALAASMRVLGRSEAEAGLDRNSAPWKVAVAGHLKQSSQADNGWLAARLHMGKPGALSQYVGQMRRGFRPEAALLLAELIRAESRRIGRNPD